MADSGLGEYLMNEAFHPEEESAMLKPFLCFLFAEYSNVQSGDVPKLTRVNFVSLCERLCEKYASLSAYLLHAVLCQMKTEMQPLNILCYRQILEQARAQSESTVSLTRDCEASHFLFSLSYEGWKDVPGQAYHDGAIACCRS